jgi:tRNA A-37 threonylcarbamoyl transferase component Bud32
MNDAEGDTPLDERALAALDAYVDALQKGERPDRECVLREFPELATTLTCLEAVERLAQSGVADVSAPGVEARHKAAPLSPEWPSMGVWQTRVDFGGYELLEELGRGGMGVVYKARQKSLGRVVALKMILPTQLPTEQAVLRFQAEARAAARLRHPNVVAVHEVGELHGQPYFTMDYVEGRELGAVAAGQPMEPRAAARLMAQVAGAVEHLHQHGIVHRDLKPSNILVDQEGHPYVTDFGLALACGGDSQLTQSGMIVGTPSYMAPEQAAGRRQAVGPGADVYSLGAILYELATGRPPFDEPTPLETLVQVLEGEPPAPRTLNRHLPRDLELVILRCLEKRPEARYPSAGALAADLERFLREEPVEARPRGPQHRLVRWCRRRPALAIRLAAVLIFALVAHVSYTFIQQVTPLRHAAVLGALGMFAAAAAAFEWAAARARNKILVPFAWSTADMLLASFIIWITHNQFSPLVVAFPLLIATAGLWFRVRLVWFSTALAAVAYTLLTATAQPPSEEGGLWHHHLIFVAALLMVGTVTAYQVWRVRALSRYYERRPLPGG